MTDITKHLSTPIPNGWESNIYLWKNRFKVNNVRDPSFKAQKYVVFAFYKANKKRRKIFHEVKQRTADAAKSEGLLFYKYFCELQTNQ